MNKTSAPALARVISIGLVLALLILVSGLASAQTRNMTASVTEVAKLTASDGASNDEFGYSMSVSGATVVVGAYQDDDNGDSSGSAYLFEKPWAGWADMTETVKLTAADGAEHDFFGWSVSIGGDTVVVGAHGDDGKGSAYVFERDEGGPDNWGQAAKLTASDGASGSAFGAAVSISGDTVVVGAPGDDTSGSNFGSAYLFEKPEGGWTNMTETAKIGASDGVANDYFGRSLSINGDTVVVSGFGDDHAGRVFVFERDAGGAGSWGQVAKLTASDAAGPDFFGWSTSISGDTVVAGAHQDDDQGDASGSAYLFVKPGSGWTDMTETAKLTASDGAEGGSFGYSVSISGAALIVGAPGDDDNGTASGAAYLFRKPEAGWASMTETAKITASDAAEQDYFGWSTSISGSTATVGAYHDDDSGYNSGSAYVFSTFAPVAWVYLPGVLHNTP